MSFNNPQTYNLPGNLPSIGGVYGIANTQGQIIYIGQTDDLQRRITEHINDKFHCIHRYNPELVYAEIISSEMFRLRRETQLIAEYNPPCNRP